MRQVAKRLRANRNTKEIPIIFLTEQKEREDRLRGLEIGGDDYITKPFDIQELRLRVRNALQRLSKGVLRNPVTDLPEGPLVDERLRELITEQDWAILAIRLTNLENFKETYGFIASDDVLRATSLMIHNTMRDVGTPNDFLGHLTPTTFGLVTTPAKVHEMRERIETRLEQSLEYFYPLKDRETIANQETALSIQINELQESDAPLKNISEIKNQLLKS